MNNGNTIFLEALEEQRTKAKFISTVISLDSCSETSCNPLPSKALSLFIHFRVGVTADECISHFFSRLGQLSQGLINVEESLSVSVGREFILQASNHTLFMSLQQQTQKVASESWWHSLCNPDKKYNLHVGSVRCFCALQKYLGRR